MIERRVLLLTSTLAVASLSACLTTPVQHATASGRPEVTIARRGAKSLLADITNEMVNIAYVPRTRSETVAVFEKDLDRAEAFIISGGPGENKPVRRVTFDIVESETSTRVLATLSIVTDPGGRKEKATPVNDSKESFQWQQLLDRIKARHEGTQAQTRTERPAAPASPATSAQVPAPRPVEPPQAPARAAPPTLGEQMSVAEMQRLLSDRGYQVGAPDGVMGKRTVDALKKFQQDSKLPPTGKLDKETALRLRGGN